MDGLLMHATLIEARRNDVFDSPFHRSTANLQAGGNQLTIVH
jgi:hypothetical protein